MVVRRFKNIHSEKTYIKKFQCSDCLNWFEEIYLLEEDPEIELCKKCLKAREA